MKGGGSADAGPLQNNALSVSLTEPPKLHRLYRQLLFTPHLSPYKQHLTLTLYLTNSSDFRIFHSVNLCPNTPLKVLFIFGPTQTGRLELRVHNLYIVCQLNHVQHSELPATTSC